MWPARPDYCLSLREVGAGAQVRSRETVVEEESRLLAGPAQIFLYLEDYLPGEGVGMVGGRVLTIRREPGPPTSTASQENIP